MVYVYIYIYILYVLLYNIHDPIPTENLIPSGSAGTSMQLWVPQHSLPSHSARSERPAMCFLHGISGDIMTFNVFLVLVDGWVSTPLWYMHISYIYWLVVLTILKDMKVNGKDYTIIWLVVDLPLLKKIWVRQLGWWHSQLNGKIKHVPKHQPVCDLTVI